MWTASGFQWYSFALMQAEVTVQPQTHSLTSYHVKLCVCACERGKTVEAAAHLLQLFACGFLRLGFGYCWFTTALTLLRTPCLCLPVTLVSTRAIEKKKI